MFKRKIEDYLLNWKQGKRKPLIIKGLRQIGKTSIVKKFASENYENAYIIDFRKDESLKSLFDGDFNIDDIAISISALPEDNKIIKTSNMVPYKTLIVLDEIQDCPNARSSLKYFFQDGKYDVICTGSLLGISGYYTSRKSFRGIPVGSEEIIEMKAMDFEEFLWALNYDFKYELIDDCLNNKKQINTVIHNQLLSLFKKYIIVGGMPEVVSTYINTSDLSEVRKTQISIIESYKSDFGTHINDNDEIYTDNTEKTKILDVFNSIPKQLSKENKKFQYAQISKHANGRTYYDSIKWLRDYGLIDICYNVTDLDEPLDYFISDNQFKIYMADSGLFISQLDELTATKILTDDLSIGKGMIYENIVADALIKNKKKLYYYSKTSGLELDFVTIFKNNLTIIDVKAKNGNSKSAKTILENPKYNNINYLKLSSQNIGILDNKYTIPYYLSFYILK